MIKTKKIRNKREINPIRASTKTPQLTSCLMVIPLNDVKVRDKNHDVHSELSNQSF